MQFEQDTARSDLKITEEAEAIASLFLAEQNQPFADLKELLKSVREAQNAAQLLGYSVVNRGAREEAIERPISGAYYASLSSYRRDEPAQYHFNGFLLDDDFMPSRSGEIVALLDQVRAELLRLFPSFKHTLRRGRQTVGFARAWTTLWLALDAVPAADLPAIVMFSPVSPRSCDPQGDAQFAAEEHYGEPGREIGDGGQDLEFDDRAAPVQASLFDAA